MTAKSWELLGSGTAVAEMEAEAWEAEGYNLVLDSDLYDADVYDVPDPGLLTEKNGEGSWPRPTGIRQEVGLSRAWVPSPGMKLPWAVPGRAGPLEEGSP